MCIALPVMSAAYPSSWTADGGNANYRRQRYAQA